MRTEEDLRIALQHRADQAPETAQTLIAHALMEPRHSPTRARLSIAVAVAMVAALIAVPFAVKHLSTNSNGSHPSPAASSPAPSTKKVTALSWVALPPDGSWTERDMYGYPNQEDIYIALFPPPRGNGVIVTDFPPGGFDTGQLASAKPVTVDGHRGYYGQITTMTGPKPTSGLRYHPVVGPHPALAWEIAPDQWVVLSVGYYGTAMTESQLVSAATSLRLRARSAPARLPFKIGYLPGSGWQLHTYILGNPEGTLNVGFVSVTRGSTELLISVNSESVADYPDPRGLNGHVGRFAVGVIQQEVGTEKPIATYDSTTLARIIHSIVVASPSYRESSSWFTVDQLLP